MNKITNHWRLVEKDGYYMISQCLKIIRVSPDHPKLENSTNSPVDLRFDLEQIATETNSSKIVSIGLQKQHIKNHMKSIWCNTLKI